MTKQRPGTAAATGAGGMEKVVLTEERLADFLEDLARRNRSEETIKAYRRNLRALYNYLPEGEKGISSETLAAWRADMLEKGAAPRTANARIAAANSLLGFLGRRELQAPGPVPLEEEAQPELSRGEYLRLLDAARRQGKERTYLLVKVFASLGLSPGELSELTLECVRIQELYLPSGQSVYIPDCLSRELADYAGRRGVTAGPVFVTREGRLIHRSNISESIRRLGQEAQVAEEKANPRCLRRLYQATQEKLRENLSQLLRQTYDQLLEAEQVSIGWPGAKKKDMESA